MIYYMDIVKPSLPEWEFMVIAILAMKNWHPAKMRVKKEDLLKYHSEEFVNRPIELRRNNHDFPLDSYYIDEIKKDLDRQEIEYEAEDTIIEKHVQFTTEQNNQILNKSVS